MPFTIFSNYGTPIIENLSFFEINSKTSEYFFLTYLFASLSFLLVASFIILRKKWKENLFYFLISLFGVIIGFAIMRGITIFLLLAYIPLVRNFTRIEKQNLIKIDSDSKQFLRFTVVLIASLFILINTYKVFQNQKYFASFAQDAKAGTDFFIKNDIHGPIFNTYDVGSYLVYRLYPEEKVYLFTRPEAFPAEFLENYFYYASENKEAFEKEAKKYRINSLIIYLTPEGLVLLEKIKNDVNWIPIYFDNSIVIFVRNNKLNQALIEKYSLRYQK